MKRVLFIANSDRHIKLCHLPYLDWLQKNNYITDVATNTDNKIDFCNNKYNIKMNRSPFNLKNIKSVFMLSKILKENNYDLIHTNTPVGSVVTRLACIFSKCKSKVIYTCHGFHFYKGAPLYYWIFFYPIEKLLMKKVDILIVMNREDYNFAQKHFSKLTDIRYIKGVGFNQKRLDKRTTKKEVNEILKRYDLNKESFIISYIAEYSNRKRQKQLIKYLSKHKASYSDLSLLLIGDDITKGKIHKLVEKENISDIVKLIDFTNDITPFLDISNIIISFSKQEGLPLNVMEAIYKRKILIVSNCRGNTDLVKNNKNGFVINNEKELFEKVRYVKENYNKIVKSYKQEIKINSYSSEYILNEVVKIYKDLL